MEITEVRVRDVRSHTAAVLRPGPGLTVLHGPNGAGKTNVLEALYLGCTGRSFRGASDRELVRFGAPVARVEVDCQDRDGAHTLSVGVQPGERKRMRVDGAPIERLTDTPLRPLVSVFAPDRLEIVKGTPALRRAHLDQVVTALWPARAAARTALGRALAQRNALLVRVRAGGSGRESLPAWDQEVARHGIAVMANRAAAVAAVAERFTLAAGALGLDGAPAVEYRPRSSAQSADGLAAELADRTEADLERGFTGHGPHRDELRLEREGRELRTYGSQGQQRLALLALLLAERDAIAAARDAPPVMLLDDVTSELDRERRERLVALLARHGQALVSTTDAASVPSGAGVRVDIEVPSGLAASTGTAAA